MNDVAMIREYKEKLGLSTKALARALHIDSGVLRSILRGDTDHLRKTHDGTVLPPGTGRYLISLDLAMNYTGPTDSKRPIRRDGRVMIAGWKKTEGSLIPDREDLPLYMKP